LLGSPIRNNVTKGVGLNVNSTKVATINVKRVIKAETTNGKHLLVEFDCVVLQGKHIVREHNHFVIPLLMVANQVLTGLELVGIHSIQ